MLKKIKVLTTCGYCGCNFYLNVEDNKIVGVTPKNDHPVSQRKLCVKRWQGHSFINNYDRLKQPLIIQADGSFKEATWTEVFQFISDSLKSIIEKKFECS